MRQWCVQVEGFPPQLVEASSRAKAKALTWRDYCDAWEWIPFLKFMRRVRVTVGDNLQTCRCGALADDRYSRCHVCGALQ